MRRIVIGFGVVVALAALALWGAARWYAQASRDPSFYEETIAGFEAADRESPPPEGVVVFTGSSSVRFWQTLAEDMAPLPVVNRGFGGSHMDQVLHFAPRIILPYDAAALLVYAGDNDLAEGSGKTPERVLRDFQALVALVRASKPALPIYFISIKPSTRRWDRWPAMSRANALVAAWSAQDPKLAVLDVATPMLGADGTPREELFVFDGLHMNASGYAVWTDLIRPRLFADLDVEPDVAPEKP